MSWLLWGGKSYAKKVLSIQPGNLIAYWPLWEAAGGVADNLEGTAARDGAYTGVTLGQPGIGDGRTCPFFDGINDVVDIFSASLNTAWAQGDSAVMIWAKVFNVGVWTDATSRSIFTLQADANNQDNLKRNGGTNNQILGTVYGGAEQDWPSEGGLTTIDWMCFLQVINEAGNSYRLFHDGLSVANGPHSGPWVGNLGVTTTCIGAFNTIAINPWYGWLAHMAIWSGAGSAAAIEAAAVNLAIV